MKKYDFMNPKTKLSKVEAELYLKKKYGMDVISDFEDYDSEIPKYIKLFIEESDYKKKINISALEIDVTGSKNQSLWENTISEVCKILKAPVNYYDDIICANYMGVIYGIEDYDLFKLEIAKSQETEEENVARELSAQHDLENMKKSIQDAWKKSDKHVDKKIVRKNYPVPIIQLGDMESFIEYDCDEDELKNEKYNIRSIPGGCYEYHKTMISQNHINIFDTNTQIKDYTRYSFKNTYDIYDSLKDCHLENLLLMEYSLGIGYMNRMYPYIRELDAINKVEDVLNVICAGVKITPFVLRMKIMSLIFSSQINLTNSRELDNAERLVDAVADVVAYVYERILELQWYKYCYFIKDKEKRLAIWTIQIQNVWKQYYNDEPVYQDWIAECDIHDWRGIQSFQDCFWNVLTVEELMDLSVEEDLIPITFEYLNEVDILRIQNVFDEETIIFIGLPKNEIGKMIDDKVYEKMRKMKMPKKTQTLCKRFYRLREQQYYNLKRIESEKFKKMEIKIRRDNKKKEQKLSKQHVYAMLSREVIGTLLYLK